MTTWLEHMIDIFYGLVGLTRAGRKWNSLCLVLVSLAVLWANPAAADTLDEVKSRGFIRCGVNQGLPGFSEEAADGTYSGMDVDYCRALAAAIFDDTSALRFTKLTASERFDALLANQIDILARNTTWTLSRDIDYGEFVGVSFYDGQGFMVRRQLGISSALELDGAKVCVTTGTTTELNAVDFFKQNRVPVELVEYPSNTEAVRAYDNNDCDVFTTDRSGLAAQKGKLSQPNSHIVLPEIISKEPLGPIVRHGDDRWEDVARWTLNCLINAEELGITKRNVNQKSNSKVPAIRRLLGFEGEFGDSIGLVNTWCYNAVALVGNYSEIYERNVGVDTPLNLKRGVNELWTNGGILYAPPIR